MQARLVSLEKRGPRPQISLMISIIRMFVSALMALTLCTAQFASADPVHARSTERQQRMLKEIAADYRATGHLTGRRRMTPALEAALSAVPREAFVPESQVAYAYINRPLSIGHGQTISQPFIVALMTDLLDIESGSRVSRRC